MVKPRAPEKVAFSSEHASCQKATVRSSRPNTDVETIQKVKADLKGWKLGRALFVGDAGFNSEENRDELAKACGT